MVKICEKLKNERGNVMSLIKCSECGKEFSDKAPACPNCGCPVGAMKNGNDSNLDDIWNTVPKKSPQNNNQTKISFSSVQKVSVIQIDEENRKFRIKGAIAVNGKKTGLIGGAAKGILAMSTFGMSVAAEKAIGIGKKKVGSKEWYEFDDLLSYELLEDDAVVTSGGVGQALIGGFAFGGAGMIAGGLTGKRVQKKRVESICIKVTINDFSCPCVIIPIVTKPIKTNSKEYQNAFNEAHKILSVLDVISHNK